MTPTRNEPATFRCNCATAYPKCR